MIEIDENTSIYRYASGRHTPELGILVMWLFFVVFTGTGCSFITVLSWARGILLGFGRNAFGAALMLNLTLVDLLLLILCVFVRGITVAADRWVFGRGGCGFFPLLEEYLVITRTVNLLVIAMYPFFCNTPNRGRSDLIRGGLLIMFIWLLALIPLVAAVSTGGYGMHIEYTPGYGGCAIHNTVNTFYRPSLILFSNLIVQAFLYIITICSLVLLYRKNRLINLPREATAPPQTITVWMSIAGIVGLIPYVVISIVCMFPGVVFEEISPRVNMFQLCWYYGSLLFTPFVLYWVDWNYRQYFRYLILGKDACEDKRVLYRTQTFWFRPDYFVLDEKPSSLAQVNDDLRLSVNIS